MDMHVAPPPSFTSNLHDEGLVVDVYPNPTVERANIRYPFKNKWVDLSVCEGDTIGQGHHLVLTTNSIFNIAYGIHA